MASYRVLFIDKSGTGITGKELNGSIPDYTVKLIFYNSGLEFYNLQGTNIGNVSWSDKYQSTGVESIICNNSSVGNDLSSGEEVDYNGGDLEITVCYEYTPSNPGGSIDPGGGTNPGIDTTPITVTFNYYVNNILVDDDKFKAIGKGSGLSVDEIWPRTLECYHIGFDKINPTETSNPGTSGSTQYNSLEFTYVSDLRDTSSPNKWPSTGSLNNYKLIQAFSNTYFSKDKCVEINGVGYEPGAVLNKKPQFHYGGTKTLEVNLYYTTVQVSTIVRTYNRDSSVYNIEEKINNNAYLNRDLWGYTSVGLNNINYSNYTYNKIKYDVPLTSGNKVICFAMYKSGFEFVKWVNTKDVEKIHANYAPNSVDRQNKIDKLTALKDETGAENDRDTGPILHLSAYENHDVTAIFRPVKNKVKLYKGLDFYGSDTYYIWGGDKQWKNSGNSNVKITIPTREGAKLLGWVAYTQNDNSLDYPTITRSEYNTLKGPDFNSSHEDIFNYICASREKIKKGVIRIDNFEDVGKPVLLSGVDGYTDSQGNWLTGNKSLYPLWLVEEYPIKYVSAGYDKLYVDETDIDKENGQWYELSPEDYKLPLTYTIVDDDFEFPALKKHGDIAFPEYYSFDKWEPSEIKKFSKTGEQTITAYWKLDTYKITLEKNNNYANQSVKIKIGQSTFVGDEKVKAPTTRTAYKSFEGWYTKNNEITNNGCDLTGKLIINKEGILQPNVEGYTDSTGRWIKEGNTTVYAKWTPEEYIITYHLEGISNPLEGILNPIKHTYTIEDTKIKIINNGSSSLYEVLENGLPLLDGAELNYLTGKSLDCWYTNANYIGTKKQYLEKGSYGNKTFYGIYKTVEYNIVYYNIEGCTNTEDLPAKHTYGSKTDLIKPILPLYKFLDWYTDENFENPITSIPADYTGDSTIKLYAKKVPELIPISYKDSNGKDLTKSSFNSTPPISYDYENGTELVRAHKNGYNFDGWYDNQECTGKSFMSLDKEKYTTAVVLYCKFTPIPYNITYYVDGVKNTNTGNPSSYTVEDLPITLKSLTKEGYNSTGWRLNSASGAQYTQIAVGSTGNKTFYWTWAANVVTITWNANGGSVSQTSSTYTYNGAAVSMPTPTRTGYDFVGWFTAKTGGTKINDVGITNKPTSNVTYYAHWTPTEYTITLNPNGGSGGQQKVHIDYLSSSLKSTITNPTKTGHTFEGWYTTASGGSLVIGTDGKLKPNVKDYTNGSSQWIKASGATLYAKWTANKRTLTWDLQGGTVTTAGTCAPLKSTGIVSGEVNYASSITAPIVSKNGYTFLGWSENGVDVITPKTTMPDGNLKYIAVYSINTYQITVNDNLSLGKVYIKVNGENKGTTYKCTTGETITLVAENTIEYVLSSWKKSGGSDIPGLNELTFTVPGTYLDNPTGNNIFTAYYEQDPRATLKINFKVDDAIEKTAILKFDTTFHFLGDSTTDGYRCEIQGMGAECVEGDISINQQGYFFIPSKYNGEDICMVPHEQGSGTTKLICSNKGTTTGRDGGNYQYYLDNTTKNQYCPTETGWQAYLPTNVAGETHLVFPAVEKEEYGVLYGPLVIDVYYGEIPERFLPPEDVEITTVSGLKLLQRIQNKIATFKWLNNLFGEPEKTSWNSYDNSGLKSFLKDDSKETPSSIHCIEYGDLQIYNQNSGNLNLDKTIKQYSLTSDKIIKPLNGQVELNVSKIEGNKIYFNISNLSGFTNTSNGIYIYFSVNNETGENNATLYKMKLPKTPSNKGLLLTIPNISNIESLYIYRTPIMVDSTKTGIIPKILFSSEKEELPISVYDRTTLNIVI